MPESARIAITACRLLAIVKYAYSVWLSARTSSMPLAADINCTATCTVMNWLRILAQRTALGEGRTIEAREVARSSTIYLLFEF
jgi:hypothetical protein